MMRSATHWLCLLAQRSTWERLGDRFSGDNAKLNASDVLLIVGGAAVFVLVIALLHRYAGSSPGRRAGNSPRRLFRELCRAHRLGQSHRRLLKRLAALRELPNAAVLFVEPAWFEAGDLPAELAGHEGELERIRERLFAAAKKPGGNP